MTRERLIKQNLVIEIIHWLSIALILFYAFFFSPEHVNKEAIIILCCISAIYGLVVHRFFPRLAPIETKIKYELWFDVPFIALVLAFTGFSLSPFFFLFFLCIMAELIIQGPHAIYPQTFYISATYLLMSFFQPKGLWAQPDVVARIAIHVTSLWMVAFFARNLKVVTLAAEEKKK